MVSSFFSGSFIAPELSSSDVLYTETGEIFSKIFHAFILCV